MKLRIITDSASDLLPGEREDLQIVPIHILFGDREYLDGVNLSHREFYEKLIESDVLPTTSQITPGSWEEIFQEVREAGDRAIVIPMSSKLSGTYQSACIAAEDFGDCIFVVDSENVTLGQRCLVEYALCLKESGMEAPGIVEELNRAKKQIRVIGLLDTLEYLKKGGRISSTVAFAGTLLSMKPVVTVQEGEVRMLGKARGSKQGNNLLVQEIEKSGGVDFSRPFFLGYTGLEDSLLQKYIRDSAPLWESHVGALPVSSIGSTIGTHVGPGTVAVAFFAKKG